MKRRPSRRRLMHVRIGLLLTIAVLAVAACASTTPARTAGPSVVAPSAAPTDSASASASGSASASPSPTIAPAVPSIDSMPSLPAGIEFVPVSALTLSSDHRTVTLAFAGARPFDATDPCSADYSVWTRVGDVLDIGVWESRRPAGAHGCDAMGLGRSLRPELDRPFDGSIWRDVSGPYVHFLAAPSGLATFDVPEGWRLIDEGDLEDSPTGRWQRTYAPRADAPVEQTLSLYQSFEGPVNVTGGEETASVTVGGRQGTAYRHAPTGEIVLVWPWGAGELAMSANERVITMSNLIRIAESAR